MENINMHTRIAEKIAELSAMISVVLCNAFTEPIYKIWHHIVNGLPNWPTFEGAFFTELSVAIPVLIILHYGSRLLRYIDSRFTKKKKKDEVRDN